MIEAQRLYDKQQTAEEMRRLSNKYSSDLAAFEYNGIPLNELDLNSYYDLIRSIPFKEDIEGVEVVTRPYLLFDAPWRGWDCKKKAIAISSYLNERNIPNRYVAISNRPDKVFHHVLTQGMINDEWQNIDPTYSYNKLFDQPNWTNAEILGGETVEWTHEPVLLSLSGNGAGSPEMTREFLQYRLEYGINEPEYLGIAPAIIAGIIAGVSALSSTIIGGVASKRQQERAQDYAMSQLEEARQIQVEDNFNEMQRSKYGVSKTTDAIKEIGIPVGLGTGIFLAIKNIFGV